MLQLRLAKLKGLDLKLSPQKTCTGLEGLVEVFWHPFSLLLFCFNCPYSINNFTTQHAKILVLLNNFASKNVKMYSA